MLLYLADFAPNNNLEGIGTLTGKEGVLSSRQLLLAIALSKQKFLPFSARGTLVVQLQAFGIPMRSATTFEVFIKFIKRFGGISTQVHSHPLVPGHLL